MNFTFNINSLIVAIFLFHRGFAEQPCREGRPDQNEIISSLDQLRAGANPPFMVGRPKFRGNRVKLAGPTFKKLENNSFICDTCEYITALNLTGHQIEEIEDGAFQNLRCLKKLDVSANYILKIHPGTFADLRGLEVSTIRTNNVEVLKNMTFVKNYNLTEIDLTSNHIKYIEFNAFYNLTSLKSLYLRGNDITYLIFDTFYNAPKLKRLDLAFNKLLGIEPPREFVHSIIENLDVSHNQLSETIERIYLPNVKTILLTGNNISKMDIDMLSVHCLNLESIELSDNNWECEELAKMEDKLQEYKIKYGQPVKCIRNIHVKYSDFYSPKFLYHQSNNKGLTIFLMVVIIAFVLVFICHFVGIHIRERDVCSKWGRLCGRNSNPEAQNEEIGLVPPL